MKVKLLRLASVLAALAVFTGWSTQAFAAECSEGTTVSQECLGYTYEGCCDAAGATYWCDTEAGPTCMIDCAGQDTTCGWNAGGGFYGCGSEGADPDGIFPYDCVSCDPACEETEYCDAGTCMACACDGAVCGVDQCGVSCGTCAEGTLCQAGVCVVPPQCVETATVVCDDVLTGDTTAATSALSAYTCQTWGETGGEIAYKFVASVNDTLMLSLVSEVDLDLVVTEGLCAEATCVAQFDSSGTVAVEAGKTYFIIVEGYGDAVGPYTLTVGCQSTCVPKCENKNCGDDGCGGTCGACDTGLCANGWCYDSDGCVPQAGAGCGGCGCEACVCALDSFCCDAANGGSWDGLGQQECLIDCGGCGAQEGCGDTVCKGIENCESCPADCACAVGSVCNAGTCCTPDCTDKECGDDGCGGTCGTCEANEVCNLDQVCEVCFPECDGKQCGDNGCGGTCGTCEEGKSCSIDGQCVTSTGPAECLGGSTPSSDDCMGLTYEGCCDAAGRLLWCDGGQLYCIDCGANAATCGWLADQGFYDCGNEGEDPTGEFPIDCSAQVCDPACTAGQVCEDGVCVACTADCAGKDCGDDGCGGSCGTCTGTDECNDAGECIPAGAFECLGGETPSAESCGDINDIGCCDPQGRVFYCLNGALFCIDCTQAGDGSQCGWSPDISWYDCGTDGSEDPSGDNPITCPDMTCTADCTGKVCGPDGCDGTCGTCGAGETCSGTGQCVPDACTPDCAGKECGDDGCEGSCGLCAAGEICNAGQCEAEVVCTPVCDGKQCGSDGCEGSCGTCAAGETCAVGGICEKGVVEDVVEEDLATEEDTIGGNDTTAPGGDTGTGGGGGGGGSCSTTGNASSGAALLVALMLAALAFFRRSYGRN